MYHYCLSVLAALILCLVMDTAQAITVTDDRNVELELKQPAHRIISLSPHVTELLFDAGAGAHLIAAVEFSDYPAQAKDIPRVGDALHLDIERIVSLQPDLVVGWLSGNDRRDIAQLEKLGLRVFLIEAGTLQMIPGQLQRLGRLAGSSAIAERAATDFQQQLEDLRVQYQGQAEVSVFYQIWDSPLMTINGRHIISDAIRLCGGRNIFAELDAFTPTISLEAVLEADPQVIIANSPNPDDRSVFEVWQLWSSLRAVKQNNLVVIPADLISRATPRMLDGAALLCQALERARQPSR